MKNTRGITLIALIITIIVLIILVGVVILNVTKNNPVQNSKKAKFLSDINTFKTELELYIGKKQIDTSGEYDRSKLNATKDKVSESGIESTDKNISDIITGIKNTKYVEKFQIENGNLIYVGKDKNEIMWAAENRVEVTAVKIEVSVLADEVSISGRIKVTGSLVEVEKIEKYEIYVAKKNEEYSSSPNKVVTEKNLDVEYNIDGLVASEEYKVKVILVMDGIRYQKEISNIVTGDDVTPPNIEEIEVIITPNTWTNKSVTVTINNIPEDAVKTQYTLPNSAEWIDYKGAFEVVENGQINIRVEDIEANEAIKTVIIEKIDNKPPSQVVLSPNGASNVESITVGISAVDNESGVKSIKYQWKTTNTLLSVTDESWNSSNTVENGESIVKNFETITNYLHLLVEDNVGNKKAFVSQEYRTSEPTYIPNGFSYLCGTVETGYVIKDAAGNEFVWVPVDGINVKYGRYNYGFGAYSNESDSDNIRNSVETYKGFYVARYEAGDASATSVRTSSSSSTNKVVSQPNKYVYNYIKRNDALRLSNNMYNKDTTGVTSTLMTSYLWETMLKWIETDSRYAGSNFVTDSTGKGWYSNNYSSGNPYHKTGIPYNNGANCVKNIYDLAGNMWEWSGSSYIIKGAYYMDNGKTSPVCYGFQKDSTSYDGGISFRVILFK